MFLRTAFLSATAAGVILAISNVASQTPPSVTFQVEVNYVDIDAVVTDERGTFVANLSKEDFELLEDGKPQPISTFSLVDIPVPVAGSRAQAAIRRTDVKSNAQPISGRLYVIVLDDLNVSPLRSKVVVNAAREFIERHFAPDDIAAITYTSGRTDGAQEFTSDRAALLAAIDRFQGRKLRSTVIEKADQYFQQHLKELEINAPDTTDPDYVQQELKSGTVRGPSGYSDITTDADDFERGHRAQQVLGALRRLADVMGGIRGRRKAILMFSEGIDYPIYDIFGSQAATGVVMATRDAIAAAARGNVSFFSVDPRGLVGMTSEAIELNGPADAHLGFDAKGLLADMYLSQDSLRTLAEETGGYAAVNANNMTAALNRIVRANSTYYVLGYYPDTPRDGRFHKIEVRVKRPGLRVSARKGYVSPRPLTASERTEQERARAKARGRSGTAETSDELREILNQPLQRNGLTLAVHAAPFKGASRQASVALAIELDAARLHFTEQPTKTFADHIELSLFALDERGKAHGGNFYQFNLALRPETFQRVRQSIVRLNPRMTLPPGRYQLRIGVREDGGGEMGSVFHDLQVPDYTANGLAMSGLVLTADSTRLQFTAQPDSEMPAGTLPSPATSRRTFGQDDVLTAFAEVYENLSSRTPPRLEIVTTLTGADGVAAFSSRESMDVAADAGTKGGRIQVMKQIPLKSVRPGPYTLRMEARALGGGAKPVVRETDVTVANHEQ